MDIEIIHICLDTDMDIDIGFSSDKDMDNHFNLIQLYLFTLVHNFISIYACKLSNSNKIVKSKYTMILLWLRLLNLCKKLNFSLS